MSGAQRIVRVAVLGATSGIGRATAVQLARQGATVAVVGRDRDRTAELVEVLTKISADLPHPPKDQHVAVVADLSNFAEAARAGEDLAEKMPVLNCLVNNVGGLFGSLRLNAQGHEMTLALNHFAGFICADRLIEALVAGAGESHIPSRIVQLTSRAHRWVERVDWENLERSGAYKGIPVYAETKLMNIFFVRKLKQIFTEESKPIRVFALHPGDVATGIGVNKNRFLKKVLAFFERFATISPEKSARGVVQLALEGTPLAVDPAFSAGESGGYFNIMKREVPGESALDDAEMDTCWKVSTKILAESGISLKSLK